LHPTDSLCGPFALNIGCDTTIVSSSSLYWYLILTRASRRAAICRNVALVERGKDAVDSVLKRAGNVLSSDHCREASFIHKQER
jgi:hypothetical protein